MVTRVSNSMLANVGTGSTDLPTNASVVSGIKNRLINGDMCLAQRGTSFPNVASASYTLDRWQIHRNGGAVTIAQGSGTPPGLEFQKNIAGTVDTAVPSLAATEFVLIQQKIEGYNVRDLIGRAFTLSFWVYSPLTGVHCIALRNSGDDRSYIAEYTVNAANTWEKKSITVQNGLTTAGTWNWTTGIGLQVGWCFGSGTSYQTTKDAWQVGNFIATANQVNCLGVTGGVFAITGTQLEVGSAATGFEHRHFGTEVALCQRYYEVIEIGGVVCYNQSASNVLGTVTFSTPKRAVPSFSHPGVANFSNENGCTSITSITPDRTTHNHFMFLISGSGAIGGNPSRLIAAGASPLFYFNAEL